MPLNDLTGHINLPNGIDTANASAVVKAEKVVVSGTGQHVSECLEERPTETEMNTAIAAAVPSISAINFDDYFTKSASGVTVGTCTRLVLGNITRYYLSFPSYNKNGTMTVTFTTPHDNIIYADTHWNHTALGHSSCSWDATGAATFTVDRPDYAVVTPLVVEVYCSDNP